MPEHAGRVAQWPMLDPPKEKFHNRLDYRLIESGADVQTKDVWIESGRILSLLPRLYLAASFHL